MCVHVITRNSGFWSTGGQLPVGALLARDIRGAVLQRDAGPAVPVEERMGGNEQEADGRQVRRQGGRRGRQDGRDQSAAAGRHRSHAVAGAAHLQLGYDIRRRFPPRGTRRNPSESGPGRVRCRSAAISFWTLPRSVRGEISGTIFEIGETVARTRSV